jgi:putative transposase
MPPVDEPMTGDGFDETLSYLIHEAVGRLSLGTGRPGSTTASAPVARSTYYAWRNRTETPTAARRRELAEHVQRVFDESRQTFGCRRVAAQLNRDRHECSVGLVADLMRELGLTAVQPRYKRTTIPGEEPLDSPDLIGRDFDPASSAPGERLVGDIT